MDRTGVVVARRTFLYVGLTVAAIVVLFPFFWMVVTAFKEPGQAFSQEILPSKPTLENLRRVLSDYGFAHYFVNSVIVATTAALFATLFATMAGYVFAKKQFIGRDKLFGFLLASLMIPGMMRSQGMGLVASKADRNPSITPVMGYRP